ncbi:MAG TPA: endonuclease [Dehalococcoidales bacterium]|nr:endonuclease [Dehalococcoidales bacterium]
MVQAQAPATILTVIFQRLLACYGPQHWWPAGSPFEVIVGAILTQSTAWTNVEKAVIKLKKAEALNPDSILNLPPEALAGMIYSCGYYNVKTKKLKACAEWLKRRFEGDLELMSRQDPGLLRQELLAVYGIGEETADSILLYAAGKPVFVIDAYTRRIVDRLGLPVEGRRYADYQKLFMHNLPQETALFNEYHALLVVLAKNCCLKNYPACLRCCLLDVCREGSGLPAKLSSE